MFEYSAVSEKRSIARRRVVKFQNTGGGAHRTVNRNGLRFASNKLEAWRHWRDTLRILKNIFIQVSYIAKRKVWGWKDIFQICKVSTNLSPMNLFCGNYQHRGINQEGGKTRDPVNCIQYRPEKELLRMTALLVSLGSKQPRLKQVKKLTEESEADFLISSECWGILVLR